MNKRTCFSLVLHSIFFCGIFLFQQPARVIAAAGPCAAPPAGLVSWWRGELNGSDASGTNHGVLQNGVQFSAGMVSNAFIFDGVDDDVRMPANPSYDALGQFTIEFWMNANPSQPAGSQLAGLVTTDFYGIEIGSTYPQIGIHLFASTNYGATFSATSDSNGGGPTFPGGEWHHVAGTYDGSKLQLYLDGEPWGNSTPLTGKVSAMPEGSFLSIGSETGRTRCPECVATRFFNGSLDEIGLYNRALTQVEITAIFAAGAAGKCVGPMAPYFFIHPGDLSLTTGDDAVFAGLAGGTPIAYQWTFNGDPIKGATTTLLTLTNVQPAQAGQYALVATNGLGITVSSNATLVVSPVPPCVPTPAGLANWWRAEDEATDTSGNGHGELRGGAEFARGLSGKAFSLNGSTGYIEVAPSTVPAFGTNDFTMELWVNLRSVRESAVHLPAAIFIAQDEGGGPANKWLFSMGGDTLSFHVNTPAMGAGTFLIQAPFKPETNKWYHLAVVRQGNLLTAFSNAVPIGSEAMEGPTPAPNAPVTLGQGEGLGFVDGLLDEVSIYRRALSTNELLGIFGARSGGKCAVPTAPFIYHQPQEQSVFLGTQATFTVGAGGTQPLAYQWHAVGQNLEGATNASLVLTNVQFSSPSNYWVVVTNSLGSATSSVARLKVNFPPANVRVSNATAKSGAPVDVPVTTSANGNENAFSFSVSFNRQALRFDGVSLGEGAPGAALLVNTNLLMNGRVGVALSLPAGRSLVAGTQELVVVRFTPAITLYQTTTPIGFSDSPLQREVADVMGEGLAATFSPGQLVIAPAEFEGDVAPRPRGDKQLTIADWVLAGRYAALLDSPTNSGEFERADCAPRESAGDGYITVTDWVQAGRYAARLDPMAAASGPTEPRKAARVSRAPHKLDASARVLRMRDGLLLSKGTVSIPVELEALGNENALGFSVEFDPASLALVGVTVGTGLGNAVLNVNTNGAGSGRLAAVLALPAGSSFAAGHHTLLELTFQAATASSRTCSVGFVDQPVRREFSDTDTRVLTATYVGGSLAVNPLPALEISLQDSTITLNWPAWATNYSLQEAEESLAPGQWRNTAAAPSGAGGQLTVGLPLDQTNKFYRLSSPSAP